jgi:hypothetical protein
MTTNIAAMAREFEHAAAWLREQQQAQMKKSDA